MDHDYAPVLVFVYRRPQQTLQTLEALSRNMLASESVLYIYADGPGNVQDDAEKKGIEEVRRVIRKEKWCAEVNIIESKTNKGLATSIIDGVTEQVGRHGKVIVLEDDLVTSRGFLRYANDALDKYQFEEKVMQISGYQFPIDDQEEGQSLFMDLTTSWGWATWKRAWEKFDKTASGYEQLKSDRGLASKFDINGTYPYSDMLIDQMEKTNINSWAIRWWWSVFVNQGITLFPDKSLVKNIGFGPEASHTKGANPFFDNNFNPDYEVTAFPADVAVDQGKMQALEAMLTHVKSTSQRHASPMYKLIRKMKQILEKLTTKTS
ncbi:hypothetical protein [Dyadobacter sandarakinus]|uniref:Glycosyltransferase family 2 protein n=1 Tax=Dyadobacter sandarakinus TaxID=2747268 RepID=A0ABX7IBB4_9BACT|nr:hypothetical protein [Dyadobacter sandarakinus]QRR03399.1 glycosyltransferase family 2 protein [Dyadobacter sandarakinus]